MPISHHFLRDVKSCCRCAVAKPLDEFHRDKTKRDGHAGMCKACACANTREWNRAHDDPAARAERNRLKQIWRSDPARLEARNRREREAARKWREAQDPEKLHRYFQEHWRRHVYGLKPGEFERMLVEQDGRCLICKAVFEGKRTPHIDHDHDSGRVRGLLCRSCNTGIGFLDEDPGRLERAARYLRERAVRLEVAL